MNVENFNKKSMNEETKLLYSSVELDKIGINSPPIYSFNNFNDLILMNYIKRHNFFEKTNILKYSNNMSIDLNFNNVNKGKSYNNTNSNKEYIIVISAKLKVILLIFCIFNSLNKENNSFKNKNNYKK